MRACKQATVWKCNRHSGVMKLHLASKCRKALKGLCEEQSEYIMIVDEIGHSVEGGSREFTAAWDNRCHFMMRATANDMCASKGDDKSGLCGDLQVKGPARYTGQIFVKHFVCLNKIKLASCVFLKRYCWINIKNIVMHLCCKLKFLL